MKTLIGANIRKRRKILKLTIDALAKKARIGKGTLSEIENHTQHPRVWTVYKISKALNCSIEDLLTCNKLIEAVD